MESDDLLKVTVGSRVWLVPTAAWTPAFARAAKKIEDANPLYRFVGWTREEEKAFEKVNGHPGVWKL
jgi:hypothetical protein